MVRDLSQQVIDGRITWSEAAESASVARNTIMASMRIRSSPIGIAVAESIKAEGATLNELVARYTLKIFGVGSDFNKLAPADRDAVFGAIVKAAARDNPQASTLALRFSRVGRSLIYISLATSIYRVYESDDPVDTAKKEAVSAGSGVVGGMAGGALAGLACGPGAPVCVTIGVFVGGAIAALGVDYVW
jgi:hypothetical protein